MARLLPRYGILTRTGFREHPLTVAPLQVAVLMTATDFDEPFSTYAVCVRWSTATSVAPRPPVGAYLTWAQPRVVDALQAAASTMARVPGSARKGGRRPCTRS